MKFKKHGMKHEKAESSKKEGIEDKNPAYKKAESMMNMIEKKMHGKNVGKGFKGYSGSKGM